MIKNATWNERGTVVHVELDDGTVMFVPDDMANRHRVELEQWSKTAGNEIRAYTPPTVEE
jgi:hypothetical protein